MNEAIKNMTNVIIMKREGRYSALSTVKDDHSEDNSSVGIVEEKQLLNKKKIDRELLQSL